MRRRLFCLLPLSILAACAEEAPPVVTDLGPEPERVYSPGPIPWDQLSEEHRRRARMMLARHGEAVPEEEDGLRARWVAMSPAQQRFAIRAPSRMAAPRDGRSRSTRSRGTTGQATPSRSSTPPRQGSTTRPTTPRPQN